MNILLIGVYCSRGYIRRGPQADKQKEAILWSPLFAQLLLFFPSPPRSRPRGVEAKRKWGMACPGTSVTEHVDTGDFHAMEVLDYFPSI